MRLARANRVDTNQPEIAKALFKAGCDVEPLQMAGDGIPDLLVGRAGVNYLLEVKSAKGTLTPEQKDWHATWRGQKAVVRSVDEALAAVGLKCLQS